MRRQTALTALVIVGVGALLIWYVVYTRQIATKLQEESRRSSQMSSIILKAFSDTAVGAEDLALSAVLDSVFHQLRKHVHRSSFLRLHCCKTCI
jgi:hypothetical protein